MAAEVDENGQWWAFPTVVQNKDGTFKQFDDPFEALRHNQSIGNALKMPSKEAAIEYSAGGYKKGQFWDLIREQSQDRPFSDAAGAIGADFISRRQQKKDLWQQFKDYGTAVAGNAMESLDLPMKGYHGLTAVAGDLVSGQPLSAALDRGADVARQPLETTAKQLGDLVFDHTGSPAAATAVYSGALLGSPL